MFDSVTIANLAMPLSAAGLSAGYSYFISKTGAKPALFDGAIMGASVASVGYVIDLLPLPSFILNLQKQVVEGIFGALIYATVSTFILHVKGSKSFLRDLLYGFGVIMTSSMISDSVAGGIRQILPAKTNEQKMLEKARRPMSSVNVSKHV